MEKVLLEISALFNDLKDADLLAIKYLHQRPNWTLAETRWSLEDNSIYCKYQQVVD